MDDYVTLKSHRVWVNYDAIENSADTWTYI